jgi:acetyl esterase/lipase
VLSDRQEFQYVWKAVLGDRMGTPGVDAYSAPGRAEDLRGMPPTFIACGYHDVPRDEIIEFARRLFAGRVPVDLHIYSGAFHAWDRVAPHAALTRSFQNTWHGYLRDLLHR